MRRGNVHSISFVTYHFENWRDKVYMLIMRVSDRLRISFTRELWSQGLKRRISACEAVVADGENGWKWW